MPKLGMEPIRRKALIGATIAEIGASGSLDVTVGRIAKRAGVSSALAHHYFGGKEDLLLAAMRDILGVFSNHVRIELNKSKTAMERLNGIINASLHPSNFEPHVVAAWLAFYVQAQSSKKAERLLKVYVRRLHSNLVYDLCQLTDVDHAEQIAQGIAAMIDGFYIRHALHDHTPVRADMVALVTRYLELSLNDGGRHAG